VAKPNYSFEKRQRELAKKKKKEEKASRKAHPGPDSAPDEQRPGDGADTPATPGGASGPA
jgi:hypothetical protein